MYIYDFFDFLIYLFFLAGGGGGGEQSLWGSLDPLPICISQTLRHIKPIQIIL